MVCRPLYPLRRGSVPIGSQESLEAFTLHRELTHKTNDFSHLVNLFPSGDVNAGLDQELNEGSIRMTAGSQN